MSEADYRILLDREDVKRAEFQILFDNAVVGVAYVSGEGTFLKVNSKFAEILGYSRKELEGKKTWKQVTNPDDVDVNEEELKAVADGSQSEFRICKRYISKSGNSIYCEVCVNRIETEEGVFVHFLKQIQPIPMPDSNIKITRDANGKPVLQPVVPVQEFLIRNWKWVAGTVGPLVLGGVGWVGTTVSNYYEMKAKYEVQQEKLEYLDQKLKSVAPTPKPN